MNHPAAQPRVAIACGGTGGHIFPGLAVAGELIKSGCAVTLLVSPKDVDQQAVKNIFGMEIAVLPAVGLNRGAGIEFLRGFVRSFFLARKLFRAQPPQAVLAMGGFTAAPPVFAARTLGIPTFLHESNAIPGRANRLLARFVKRAFVGFPDAVKRLPAARTIVTGTPVRPQFQPRDPAGCRQKLGLQPDRPVALVMGGSQGASGINDLVIASLPLLAKLAPELQWLHLTGAKDCDRVQAAHDALKKQNHIAVVRPFLAEMELALGAATVAISRAGASSLAELAAMRVVSVLIPFPAATDDHQLYNAIAFVEADAARLLHQSSATPEKFATLLVDLMENTQTRQRMQAALARCDSPQAAEQIAENILEVVSLRLEKSLPKNTTTDPAIRTPMLCLDGKEQALISDSIRA